MLHELYIKNCALIEEESVVFKKGMNILTGETGSGKSIVLEALSLCLGGKYDRTFLRRGKSEGEVVLSIYSFNKVLKKEFEKLDIEYDEESPIIISRKLFDDGKSITKINGRTVRVSDLRFLTSILVDVHSQHQNQALYDRDTHLKFLDMFAKNEIEDFLKKYRDDYRLYTSLKSEINRLNDNKSSQEIQREIELIKYQINEIESANLVVGEYEQLKREREILSNSETIQKGMSEVMEIISEENFGVKNSLGKIAAVISSVSKYDDRLSAIEENSQRLVYEMDDIYSDIRNYLSNVDFDDRRLAEIVERIDVVNSLRRKYGESEEDILEYLENLRKRLDDIENREEKNEKLKNRLNECEKKMDLSAGKLSDARKSQALKLEKNIIKELKSLDMKNAKFKVFFNKRGYNEDGIDDIEFYISFNLGEDMKPIYKVASGGEMSRFMLAFKTILSGLDQVETLVFDEIDTGISGIAAQNVGEKMADISKNIQLICITHLPQIAAFADEHFYIEKFTDSKRTYTKVSSLGEQGRIDEISRLISGKTITDKTIEHAEEMLSSANEIKSSRRKQCD